MLLYELFHPITGQGQGSSSFSRCFLCKFREKLDESSKSNASLMAASYSHSTYLSSWQCGIIIVHHYTQIQNWKEYSEIVFTGKYLSEALILASTNPQNDDNCSLNYKFSTWKFQAQNMLCTQIVFCFCFDIQNNLCTQHVLRFEFSCTDLVIQWTIFCYILG